MPRYSSLIIKDAKILSENVQSVFINYNSSFNFKNQDSSKLPNDIRLNWDGSLDFNENTQDLNLVYNVEAFVQSMYFLLITQIGRYPGDDNFGWDLETIIKTPSNKQNLKLVIDQLNSSVSKHPDVEFIDDIVVKLYNDGQTKFLKIELTVKPKFFNYKIFLDYELY